LFKNSEQVTEKKIKAFGSTQTLFLEVLLALRIQSQ